MAIFDIEYKNAKQQVCCTQQKCDRTSFDDSKIYYMFTKLLV